ncbi:MAG: glycosyltransferase family 2 protein [Verrucomicrobiales bacterium]|nr:glycosyltransferase family 2 protein [Nitrospinaceae bacterium]
MRTDNPKVFIIILNWNGLKDTLECLESVYKLEYSNFEVIVVDNGSTDNPANIIRNTFPTVVLIENQENLGYTGGNNVGMRHAMARDAEYVWLLNNDTVVESSSLKKLVLASEKSSDIGLVTPILYYYDKPDQLQSFGGVVVWKENQIISFKRLKDIPSTKSDNRMTICLWGTALLIKKDVIDNVGYLNNDFFAYWEDADYSVRTASKGYRNILEPKAVIHHKTPLPMPGTVSRSPHYFYYMVRNECIFWKIYLRRLRRLRYLKDYLGKSIAVAASCRDRGSEECADACLDGMWCALWGVSGIWDKKIKMPRVIKTFILWHPYVLSSLLKGNIRVIILEFLKRTKFKIMKTS